MKATWQMQEKKHKAYPVFPNGECADLKLDFLYRMLANLTAPGHLKIGSLSIMRTMVQSAARQRHADLTRARMSERRREGGKKQNRKADWNLVPPSSILASVDMTQADKRKPTRTTFAWVCD
jgi:hypothetical protein